MTAICVDRKGFHKSIVVHKFEPTLRVPYMVTKLYWNKEYSPTDMCTTSCAFFQLKNYVDGTDGQVALYEEV